MTMPKTKWRRRAAARPDEILDAALDVFIEAGFDAARMDDIAGRAGISKAGVYLYFDSKEALLRALIDREIAPIATQLAAFAEAGGADPEGTLRLMATAAIERLSDQRFFAVPRLIIAISGRFPDIADYYRTAIVENAIAALSRLVATGVAQGVFRPVDPVLAVRAIIGPVMFAAMWRHVLRGDTEVPPAKVIEGQIDLLLNGLKT